MYNIIVINDISSLGNCSLTIQIPILNAMELNVIPIPTLSLTAQTGFSSYNIVDCSDNLSKYSTVLSKLKIDMVIVGFMRDKSQLLKVTNLVKYIKEKNENTKILWDPILGDCGHSFSCYDKLYKNELLKSLSFAHTITPNVTEFSLLLEIPYENLQGLTYNSLKNLLNGNYFTTKVNNFFKKNSNLNKIIITGIVTEEKINNIIISVDESPLIISASYNSISYSGTGDAFIALYAGYLLKGKSSKEAVELCSNWISRVAKETLKYNIGSSKYGLCFSPFLKEL